MRTNIVRILVALAMISSLVGIAVAPVAAQPTVTFNGAVPPVVGPVGQPINIVANNFLPSAVITITMDGVALTTTPAVVTTQSATDPNPGRATFGIIIPAAERGAHKIVVTDGVNRLEGDFIQITPKVVISPKKGPVGSSATVTGSGFTASVTARVTVGGQNFAAGIPIAADGSFTATGSIPLLPAGARVVDAEDGAGAIASVIGTTDNFTVQPSLSLSPSSELAGKEVTVKGSGWTPGNVNLTFAGQVWGAGTVVADANGKIDAAGWVIPPAQLPGVKQVRGTDTGTNTAETNFTVLARLLSISPSSGPLGTKVKLLGQDMTPSTLSPANSLIALNNLRIATIVSLNPGGIQPGAIEISTTGAISPTEFVIPCENAAGVRLPMGDNEIQAMDGGSDFNPATLNNNLSAFGTFTVTKPTIAVTPTTGPRGTTITITGSGWGPDNPVTITFTGATVRTVTSIPDANGNFGASMTVPADANRGSNNLVGATDRVINEVGAERVGNQAEPVVYNVPPPAISITPTAGIPGTDQVKINGTGFGAYTSVTIRFGTAEFADKPLTDKFGAFEYSATCPGQAKGAIVVRATAAGETATTFFTVKDAPDTVAVATASISSNLVRVWGYYAEDWQMYDPKDVVGSDLLTLTAGRGYWIKVNADCTLIFGGFMYNLTDGWNNIGWR